MLIRSALIAAAGLGAVIPLASADTLVGTWENLVTPPPPDPDPLPQFFRRPIGSAGTESWVDFDLRGVYTSDTYGATNGTKSVKVRTADDGGGRYNQCLTLPVHVAGAVDDFLTSGQFAVDVSWRHADWVGGDWSGIDGLVINASNPGFQNVGRATFDSARPDPNDTFHGFWDSTNWGDNTRTLTWDLQAWVDGDTTNGEIPVVQAASGGGFFNLVLITNYDSAFDPSTAAFYFDNARFLPRVVSSEWKGGASDPDGDAGNGNAALNLWHASTNWTMGVPGTAGSTAIFGTNGGTLVGPQTIVLDQAAALGTASFDNAEGYTIGGSGSLTLDVATGTAVVNVASGNHVASVPVRFADDATITVTPLASSLSLNGSITATDRTITKAGLGVLQVSNLRDATLNIDAGTVRVAPNGTNTGTSKLRALNMTAGPDDKTFDLTNNAVIIDYDALSPLGIVAGLVATGYAGGSWNGTGIISSTAAGNNVTAVGFAEASALGISSFGGLSVDGSAILLRYTRIGDANLSGTTEIGDFGLLAANFNQSGTWSKGDFNYDGVTDISDFALLAAQFNQTVPAARAAVPEPAGVVCLVCVGLLARIRRRA